MKRHLANLLSISRLFLLVPLIFCLVADSRWAFPIMTAIILTDLLDGPAARKLKTAGPSGASLDAACDAAVALSAAFAAGLSDPRYLSAAALMAASFYSWTVRRTGPGISSYTRLGRYNGAVCYALLAVKSVQPWMEAPGIQAAAVIEWASLGVVMVVLGISTVENMAAAYAAARTTL
jgi:phosphatidylglycerophosphate synthase